MGAKRRNWLKELKNKATENNAKKLMINGKLIDKYEKINREMKCEFICNCGKESSKNIRVIIEISGLFCDDCTKNNRKEKVKATNIERYGVENPFQNEK